MESHTPQAVPTNDVILAFARQGVALGTISRALAQSAERVRRVCDRALECGDLQILPAVTDDDRRSPHLVEVVHLRAKLADMEALLREREKLSGGDLACAFNLTGFAGLTRVEATIVSLLARCGRVSKIRMFDEVYGARPTCDAPHGPKILDVWMCKIRRKLDPHGIAIQTVWGVGYEMAPDAAQKLRDLVGLPQVDAPSLAPEVAETVA